MYVTIVTCPVCGQLFDEITHPYPEPHAQSVALLAGPERRRHAAESPECTKHDDWVLGWNKQTKEAVDG